jgi:hypothetical protein
MKTKPIQTFFWWVIYREGQAPAEPVPLGAASRFAVAAEAAINSSVLFAIRRFGGSVPLYY